MGDNREVISQSNNEHCEDTRVIVLNFINYKLHQRAGHQQIPPLRISNHLVKVTSKLHEVVDEFEQKYRTALDDMFVQLRLLEVSTGDTFLEVVNELFAEGITWSRIVALFAFSGGLAILSLNEGVSVNLEQITSQFTRYIEQHLQVWINDNGGWNGFVEYYESNDGRERDSSWAGLKKIICGVAAGAVGALTIGAFLASKS